jgi:hypothetical protein
MSTINIREAKLEDLNILLEFEQGIITAERPYDPTLQEENQLLRHTQNDYRRTHNRFVAKIDSEIVGLMLG